MTAEREPTADLADSRLHEPQPAGADRPSHQPTTTRLALVRHGETVWHADNRYAGGSSDIDLTARGERQAQLLARWASTQPITAVVSSPVRRALETAGPSAAALGVELDVVDHLREIDFGVAEGHTVAELRSLDPGMVQRFQADPAAHPYPGAEVPERAAERAAAALRAIARTHRGGYVLVVAHNTLLRMALCQLLELPVARYRQLFPRLDNAAITEVLVAHDPAHPSHLICLNNSICLNEPPEANDEDMKEHP